MKKHKKDEFGAALLRLIDGRMRANTIDGIVEEINDNYTCTVSIQDVFYYNVPLRVLIGGQASFIEIPKVGTDCLITFRDASNSRPQILEVHECDKIQMKIGNSTLDVTNGLFKFNGGSNGGIPIKDKIQENLDTLKEYIDTLKTATYTALAALDSKVPTSATFKATMDTVLVSFEEMGNDKITH